MGNTTMLRRRDFLGAPLGLAAASLRLSGASAETPRTPKAYFGLHEFIEANPKAVFIRRTHVPHKMDGLAREIFVPLDQPGIPVSHRIILKPNFTSVPDKRRPLYANWGTGTDPQFYEGLVMGLEEIGIRKFHWVEANTFPFASRAVVPSGASA